MRSPPRLSWNARPLRALEAIARLGSVSAAAEELRYTQSAASQQLAALEREAGVTLVERGTRPLRLTEGGETVLRHAQAVLAGFVAIESALVELHGLATGRLRLAAFASSLATFIPPAIAELNGRHPGIGVEVTVLEPPEATSALRAGAADLAILHRTGPASPNDGLRRQTLCHDPLCLVLPDGHPLAARDPLPLGELARVPIVVPRADGPARAHRQLVEQLFAAVGISPCVAYEVDDLRAAQALARAGLAVVLMHDLTIPQPHPGLEVRSLANAEEGKRTIEIASLDGRHWPPAQAMADLLLQQRGENLYAE